MVGMSRASFRTECDDHPRADGVDDGRDTSSHLAQDVERCETTIGKAQEMEFADTESLGCALRFFGARRGEFGAGGNVREVCNSLRAIGDDYEMSFASFSRKTREEWSDHSLIIGVGEYGEDWPARLGRRNTWRRGGSGKGGGGDEEGYW
jgi:hypothetical protein